MPNPTTTTTTPARGPVEIPDPLARPIPPPKPNKSAPAAPRLAPDEEIDGSPTLPIADERAEPPATNGTAKKPAITLSTTVQHRGRIITITATDITVDRFCDLLEAASYAAPTPAQWHTLPDGTPICPKHNTPMRKREKQGDEWWSHRVFGPSGEELFCKGYHGKDSPGYEH